MRGKQRDWCHNRRWYNGRRRHQLLAEPFCEMCLARGQITSATIVDHVEPHGGDWNKFWLGKLQSLCKSCHDGDKRRAEMGKPFQTIGADGWPVSEVRADELFLR